MDSGRGWFNGIEFHVNEVKTHFEASSIMDQCSKMMGLVDLEEGPGGRLVFEWSPRRGGQATAV